jgi:hypothetical protein
MGPGRPGIPNKRDRVQGKDNIPRFRRRPVLIARGHVGDMYLWYVSPD